MRRNGPRCADSSRSQPLNRSAGVDPNRSFIPRGNQNGRVVGAQRKGGRLFREPEAGAEVTEIGPGQICSQRGRISCHRGILSPTKAILTHQ
jgi:hypothetical protein